MKNIIETLELIFDALWWGVLQILGAIMIVLGIPTLPWEDSTARNHQPPYTPHFHLDFDASRNGQIFQEDFRVPKKSLYYISLGFLQNPEMTGNQMVDLVNTKKIVISKDEEFAPNPVAINLRVLRERCQCSSDEASKSFREGLQTGSLIYKIVDYKGVFPLWVELKKIDENPAKTIISGIFEGSGYEGGRPIGPQGVWSLQRQVGPYVKLERGRYNLQVKTLQDSPDFFDVKMMIGVKYEFNK